MNMLREHRDIALWICAWQLLGRRYSSAHKQVIPQYEDWDRLRRKCLKHTIRVRGSMDCTTGTQVSWRRRSRNGVHWLVIRALCGSRIATQACALRRLAPSEEGGVAGSRCFVSTCSSGGKLESLIGGGSVSAGEGMVSLGCDGPWQCSWGSEGVWCEDRRC